MTKVQDPDRPHVFHAARVSMEAIPAEKRGFYGWNEKPCSTCGGSKMSPVHFYEPKRRPNLAAALAAIEAANAAFDPYRQGGSR